MFLIHTQNLVKIFTIQYLELCYREFCYGNQSKFANTLFELIQQQQFQIMLPPFNHPLSKCSQQTLKGIIKEFINYIKEHQNTNSVQQILHKFPLVLDIFIGIYRTLLQLGDVCKQYDDKIEMQQTYQFLTSYFGVQTSYDPSSSCSYFHQTNTFVFFGEQGQAYMVDQHGQQDQIEIGQIKEEQNQENEDDVIVPMDMQNISMLLGNSANKNQFDEEEVTQHISNIEIPFQSEFEAEKKQDYQCKMAQSQIIKQRGATRPNSKQRKVKGVTFQVSSKGNLTNTFNTFRQNSFNNTLHQSFKAYLNTPTTLKSQFFQGHSSADDNKNNHSAFINVLGSHHDKEHVMKLQQNKQNNQETTHCIKEKDDKSEFSFSQNKPLYQNPNNSLESSKRTQGYSIDQHPQNQLSHITQTSVISKGSTKWINKNITKQFTSSFVLMSIAQPYRSKIQARKQKARQQRKNIYQTNCYFA